MCDAFGQCKEPCGVQMPNAADGIPQENPLLRPFLIRSLFRCVAAHAPSAKPNQITEGLRANTFSESRIGRSLVLGISSLALLWWLSLPEHRLFEHCLRWTRHLHFVLVWQCGQCNQWRPYTLWPGSQKHGTSAKERALCVLPWV